MARADDAGGRRPILVLKSPAGSPTTTGQREEGRAGRRREWRGLAVVAGGGEGQNMRHLAAGTGVVCSFGTPSAQGVTHV